jgi:dTDP-4-dehydrorhamnose reductase
MKVAVIGSNGQLGRDVCSSFEKVGDQVIALTHEQIDISNLESTSKALSESGPDLVVNTAAMHHVDRCEESPEQAFAVNGIGARNLAVVTRDLGAALMHVSTDYVFNGDKGAPYSEEDTPGPLNVYGNTKLAGEYFIRATTEKHFVVRTSAIYGKNPCRAKGGLNFVELMLKLARERGEVKVVDSEFVSPTYTAELADQMAKLAHSDSFGLYHCTAEGSCSWYEFAREIFTVTNTPVKLNIAGPNEFPAKVPRPRYSVLDNAALKAKKLNVFTSWNEGLRKYLQQRSAATA